LKITTKYEFVSDFSDGYAAIKKGDKWGYIDKNDKIKIKPIYDWTSNYKDGIAVALIDNKYFFIDKNGNKIFNKGYSRARNYSEGKAFVYEEEQNKSYFININGEVELSIGENRSNDFSESRCTMSYKDTGGRFKWKIIDENYNIIADDLDTITSFNNGIAFYGVIKNQNIKWGIINNEGVKVTEEIYDSVNINSSVTGKIKGRDFGKQKRIIISNILQ